MKNKNYSAVLRAYGQTLRSKYRLLVATAVFQWAYLAAAGLILGGSTLLWAILGARLQNSNADQLVNVLLFKDAGSLQGSQLPEAHSFLLKWPLYFLIHLFSSPVQGLVYSTVATVMITVAALAFMLYRIEKRPLFLGTFWLLLASVLLLVPTVPSAGTLLPVNMAMLSTRNLEYVIFVMSVWLVARHPRFRDWRLWCGIVLLVLVIASDKLFASLAVGGALCALVFYALNRGWNLVSATVTWLLGSVLATIAAGLVLVALQGLHITHFESNGAIGPYGVVQTAHQLLIGVIYGGVSLLTNFGANPAAGTMALTDMPAQAIRHVFSYAGPGLIVNVCFLLFCLYASVRLMATSIRHNRSHDTNLEASSRWAVMLLWSTIAAFGAFVISNHYYAADARYLTVSLFALIIAAACYMRRVVWPEARVSLLGVAAVIAVGFAVPAVLADYHTNQAALQEVNNRNKLVAAAVIQHHAEVLVGDYWRAVPTGILDTKHISVTPLAGCSEVRTSLVTTGSQGDFKKSRFAYLLTLDKSLTDYPQCSLQAVIKTFGHPNSSVVTAGTLSKPKEIILFYDHGAHKSDPVQMKLASSNATVVPLGIDDYPYKSCNVPTVMNVVAHEDDDLLFISPALAHDIQVGHCVRTVYVTAGDAGHDALYWLGRMQGSEAAYDRMMGQKNIWIDRLVEIAPGEIVTIANPRGNAKVSLVFMYLPDGNTRGQGFKASRFESLQSLDSGTIQQIDSIYGGSSYTSDSFVAALVALMHLYQPNEIRTQSNYQAGKFQDHSDHMAVGRFTTRAYQQYENIQFENKITLPITYYRGYTSSELQPNVAGADLVQKSDTFLDYAKHDGGVCHSLNQCMHDPAYGAYLPRQYPWSY